MRKNGSLVRNLSFNLINFILNVIVGIFYTRYLIDNLGVSGYGLIPLCATIGTYFTVFALVFNAAVGRFIAVSIAREDFKEANIYFNTSLFSSITVGLILLFPCLWIALTPSRMLSIPIGQEIEASKLLLFTSGMIFFSIISVPFEVSTYCKNRFDLRNSVIIIKTLIRVGVVIVLFTNYSAKISYVGFGMFLSSMASFLISLFVWKHLTPEFYVDIREYNISSLKELTAAGGWVSVSQVGTLLLLNIDLFLINKLFGVESGGIYASLLQWSILFRSLALTIAGVFGPTIVILYAKNEIEELIKYSRKAVKYLGLFIALPIGCVSGLSSPLLKVWLGAGFVEHAPLLTLMTAPLCLNLGYSPLHNISTATNKVKIPGLVQILSGLANLFLAILFSVHMGLGLYGIAIAGICVLTIRNVLFTPLYGSHIIGRHYGTFMSELLPIVIMTTMLTLICYFVSSIIDLGSWFRLIPFCLFVSIIYMTFVWKIFVTHEEKESFAKMIPKLKRA